MVHNRFVKIHQQLVKQLLEDERPREFLIKGRKYGKTFYRKLLEKEIKRQLNLPDGLCTDNWHIIKKPRSLGKPFRQPSPLPEKKPEPYTVIIDEWVDK